MCTWADQQDPETAIMGDEEAAGEMTTTEEETDTGTDIIICLLHRDDFLGVVGAPPVHTTVEGHHLLVQDTDTDLGPEATLHVSIE